VGALNAAHRGWQTVLGGFSEADVVVLMVGFGLQGIGEVGMGNGDWGCKVLCHVMKCNCFPSAQNSGIRRRANLLCVT
jgi:hypothetical protein